VPDSNSRHSVLWAVSVPLINILGWSSLIIQMHLFEFSTKCGDCSVDDMAVRAIMTCLPFQKRTPSPKGEGVLNSWGLA